MQTPNNLPDDVEPLYPPYPPAGDVTTPQYHADASLFDAPSDTTGFSQFLDVEQPDQPAKSKALAMWVMVLGGAFVLLSCLVGGLLFWKNRSDAAQIPTATATFVLPTAAATATLQPLDPFQSANLDEMFGSVNIYTENLGEWIAVERPVTLRVGTSIVTGEGSRARLVLPDGSIIRMGAQTKLSIDKMSAANTNPDMQLRLENGKIWGHVPYVVQPGQSRFAVVLPDGVVSIAGKPSFFSIEWNPASELMILTCLVGDDCRYQNEKGGVSLQQMQQTEANKGQPPSPAHAIEAIELDTWAASMPEVLALTPTITPSASPTETATATETPTATPSETPTASPTNSNDATVPGDLPTATLPTAAVSPTHSPTASATNAVTSTPVIAVSTSTVVATFTPSVTGAASLTPLASASPTSTANPTRTANPTSTTNPTNTANPTSTLNPTGTANPTSTTNPTNTANPTSTLNPTNTASPTSTANPTSTATLVHINDDQPSWAADDSKIAFVSNRTGNPDIWVMNANGTAQTNLSNHAANDSNPSWSPVVGSARLLYQSERDGNVELYAQNADGSGLLRLTNNSSLDEQAVWSPNGSSIAFVSERDGNREIYVMNADGSGQLRLTSNAAHDQQPTWSPDGSKIAFASERDGSLEIWVMNADGSNPLQLTSQNANVQNSAPVWSPVAGSSLVAFISNRDGNDEVYTVHITAGTETRLTYTAAKERELAWEGGGNRLLFVSKLGVDDEIVTVMTDGSGIANLSATAGRDYQPHYNRAGNKILFVSERDGNPEIYVMNPDGTSPARLTVNN